MDGQVQSTSSLSSTITIYGTTEGCRYLIKVAGFNGVIGEYAEYDEIAGGAVNGLNIFVKTEAGLSSGMTRTPLDKNSSGICNLLLGRVNNIDIDYGSTGPTYCPTDGFTSYYIGYIKAPFTGTVNFKAATDDGFILNIQGQNVINYQSEGAASNYNATGSINMLANEVYRFEAWHHEYNGNSSAKLYWDWTGQSTVIVPQSSFGTDPTVFFGTCPLGSTAQCAAGSAMEIKQATGTNMDGQYWIMVNGVPTLTYCIMNSVMSGGGWMLAMKGAKSGSTLDYGDSLWTSTNLLNESYPERWSATISARDVDAKYGVFAYSKGNQLMALFPEQTSYAGGAIPAGTAGNTTNPYGFSWIETTTSMRPWSAYSASAVNGNPAGWGGTSYNVAHTGGPTATPTCVNTPTTLTNLFSTASRCAFRQVQSTYSASEIPYSTIGNGLFYSQTQIRFFGINYGSSNTGNRDRARFGFGWNENEAGNEGSSDGTSGIGIDRQGYGSITAGSINNCCATQAGISGASPSSRNIPFEMYVRNSTTGVIYGNNLRVTSKRINSLTAGNGFSVGGSNGSNTFRLSPVREGFNIDPSSGRITVSEQIAVGDYTMTVTSTDTDGVVGVRSTTIQVLSESRETDTALSFNGTQHSVTTGNYGLWGDQTYEAWVKPNSECSQSIGNNTPLGTGNFILFCRSNYWYISYLDSSNSWIERQTSLRVVSGAWVHLAVVRSGSTVTAFANNAQLSFWVNSAWASSASQSTIKNDYYALYVGGTGASNQYFNGLVDEVKVWDSARTLTQIWNGANSLENVSQANLLMYWDFNEGTGSAISRAQRVDNNFNLTPNSSSQWSTITEATNSGPYTVVTIPRTLISVNPGWRAPSYINAISVLVAGGGAGGGGGGYNSTTGAGGGGGGGSGAISSATVNVEPNVLYPIVIGAFGVGGVGGNSAAWNGTNGAKGETTTAFSITAKGGSGGWGAGNNSPSGWSDGTSGFGGTSGNNFTGGLKSSTVGSGGGGGGGATANGANASGASTGATGGAGLVSSITLTSITYASGGAGGVGTSSSGVIGTEGGYASAQSASGGTGGGGAINAIAGYGGSGSSGFVILRYITAQKPTFTYPRSTTLNVGMVESFSVNISADSATVAMTRTFRWESSTTGANGTFSLIKQGTGAENAFFAWTPPDTSTTGSQFVYRVIVTDSDAAGLSYTDTSTPVFATINGRLVINGKSSISKTVNISKTETFTVTGGTSTFRYSLLPDAPNFWLDTSTVGSPRLRISDTATVGTYYETLTVTDSVSAVSVIPLTIKVSPPPSFSANAEQVDSGTVLYLDAGNTSSYAGSGAAWNDISGRANNVSLVQDMGSTAYYLDGSSRSSAKVSNNYTCVSPVYDSSNLGSFEFTNQTQCIYVPTVLPATTVAAPVYTFETWVKRNGDQAAWEAIACTPYRNDADQIPICLMWYGTNTLVAGIFNGGSWFVTSTYTVPNQTWVHAAVTYNGSNSLSLYINDIVQPYTQTTTISVTWNRAKINAGLLIGRKWDDTWTYSGNIAMVRLYSRVLSQAEIAQNYNATKGRFLGTQNKQAQSGKYGTVFSDTYTVTAGSETITAAWSNTSLTRIKWDTSTARSLVLSTQESLTPGIYYDTVTVSDVYGSATQIPLTYTIAKADTLTVLIETPTALNYTGTNAIFPTTLRVTGLVSSDTGTAVLSVRYRPNGTSCATGGVCSVGDVGPGGGVVFITPSTAGGNGKYFEAAPFTWAGSDELGSAATYCSNGNLNLGATNVGIGWGETNTNLAKSACLGGAVAKVNSFNLANNTGYSDWFIPSSNEMIELAKVRTSAGLLLLGNNWSVGRYGYWSSTEISASVQASLVTSSWSMGGTGKGDGTNNLVRPVRSFTPCWSTTQCHLLATTTKPTDAGVYLINPETLTLTTGELANYVGIKYETTTVTINRVSQSVQQSSIFNAAYPEVFTMLSLSGSGTGASAYSIVSGGTASGCTADYKKFVSSSVGTCNVQIVRQGDRNYLGDTSTAYLYFMTFVLNQPAPTVGSGPNIALSGATSVQLDSNVAPTISGISASSGAIGSTLTITGAGFYFADPSKLSIKFWRNIGAVTYTINNDTSVTVTVPASATTGRIVLTTPNGQAASPTFTVTP
jgi:hypothetical protein